MKSVPCFFIAFFFCALAVAQKDITDSLKRAFKNADHDTTRCVLLYELAESAAEEEWEQYNLALYKFAREKINAAAGEKSLINFYRKYFYKAQFSMGYIAETKGQTLKALACYDSSLRGFLEINDKAEAAELYNNIGDAYATHGDIKRGIVYFNQSLKLMEELNDAEGIARLFNNIGFIYNDQGQIEKAIEYYNKSLIIREKLNDLKQIATTLNNLGTAYLDLRKPQQAMDYFRRSLAKYERCKSKEGVVRSLNNMGVAFQRMGDFVQAKKNYELSLEMARQQNNKRSICITCVCLGKLFLDQGDFSKAEQMAKESQELSGEMEFPDLTRNAAQLLYEIYSATRQYELAYKNYELYIQMRDSIRNEETNNATTRQQVKYEYDKKAAADSVRMVEDKKVRQARLGQEQTLRYALYAGLGLTGIFALFMANRFRVTSRQKKLIEDQKLLVEKQKLIVEEKQVELLDSIRYAKRIQTVLMTNEKYIHKHLRRLRP